MLYSGANPRPRYRLTSHRADCPLTVQKQKKAGGRLLRANSALQGRHTALKKQTGQDGLSRPKAIRRLVEQGLKSK